MPDYIKLKVTELKEELGKRGLPKGGLKAELVKRLVEADAQTGNTGVGPDQSGIEKATEEQEVHTTAAQAVSAPEAAEPAVSLPKAEEAAASIPADPVVARTGEDVKAADVGAGPEPIETQSDGEDPRSKVSKTGPASAEKDEDSMILPGNLTQPDSVQTSENPQLPRLSQTQTESLQMLPELTTISTQGSLTTEEILEDSKKRKRRSQSPPPSSMAIKDKKVKSREARPRVELPEDKAEGEGDGIGQQVAPPAASKSSHKTDSPSNTRFKNLFTPAPTTGVSSSTDATVQIEELKEDRIVVPSIHPATSALYIRELMRPLNPTTMKTHLAFLALPASVETTSNASPDEVITIFHLDTMRTHCLVGFSSISAASRVRTALHDCVWPNERDRKVLWVDFVPEEKLQKWIDEEQESAGGRGRDTKKWEVIYEDEDGEIKAYLEEMGTSGGGLRSAQLAKNVPDGQGTRGLPSGPRTHATVAPSRDDGAKGFQALDDLFRSTTSKPKLYFLPVVKEIAEKRLDLLDEGRGGGRGDEMRRFGFEDGQIVDKGPEYGMRGARGGRGGYRGGRGDSYDGAGGYRGRDGGYRGRGDGFRGGRGGGDSYRGSRY